MKLALSVLSVILFAVSFILSFCLIGYKFLGVLTFAIAVFFLYLALSIGIKKKSLIILRRIIVSLVICGAVFTAGLTGVVISGMSGDSDVSCDYVIVLGAGLDGEIPSLTLTDRLSRCVDYMTAHPESIAVVSGGMGDGETITEALAMERYLTSRGIPESRIIKEERATSTNENLKFSKAIIDSRGGGSIAVISSDYHIFRARLLALRQGISPTMISARSSLPVLRFGYALRESFALVKAKLLGNI